MASMNNWLGFSLSPQQLPSHAQPQISATHDDDDVSGQCFDHLTSDSILPSLNLPAHFGFLESFHRNNHTQEWNMKEMNDESETSYKTSSEMLMDTSSNNNESQDQPKLENFLGISGQFSYTNRAQNLHHQGCNNNIDSSAQRSNAVGLSTIKNWLRNNPTSSSQPEMKNDSDASVNGAHHNHNNNHQSTLSLSMSSAGAVLPLFNGGASDDNGRESIPPPEKKHQNATSPDSQSGGAMEAVPRKSIETFGQRTSIYRGVTRHRWTGRYEAHLWDNSCRREGQTRKGRQVYLGGYDKEEKAARAYDLAALKYWSSSTTTNFPISDYEKELEEMKHMTRQEFVASLRRKSSGFSRGASIYRGVTRHHQHGRWQARIGRVAGNKDLYLGTFSTQEEAAEAYDIAAIKFRGLNAVTNFEISRYDVKSILESSTLPIGGAAKRLKDAEQAAEMSLDAQRITGDPNLTDAFTGYAAHHHGWPSIAFQQAQPLSMHYAFGQPRLWYKQEHDAVQLGNAHSSFLQQQQPQPSVLHNLMSLDSSSMEHSSDSSCVNGNGGGYNAAVYGSSNGGSYMLPMAMVVAHQEGGHSHGQANGYGDSEVKPVDYENVGYYHSHQPYANATESSSTCNTWVPTAVPTLAATTNNMAAVCHGAQTFTVWDDT